LTVGASDAIAADAARARVAAHGTAGAAGGKVARSLVQKIFAKSVCVSPV
jgi:hypothetical protein